jgi:hypothetical protein
MKTASRRTIEIIEFERWIQSIPDRIDVQAWTHNGLALWPLFKTTLVGLGILARIEQPKRGMPTGGLGWRAGVMADYFAMSGLRKTRPLRLPMLAPAEGLSGAVVYYASGGHGRDVGELFVTPSLDVPAALLGRAGRRSVFWYEDLETDSESLQRTLHRPAYGLWNMLADARGRAMRFGTRDALAAMPGFAECCETAAEHLNLKKRFLQLWFARQVNLAISVAQTFEQVFARDGHPELLVTLNSCVWSTTGLVAAAKRNGVPVIEVHHGAESQSAVTAPGQRPHFSTFGTAPDALISWDCRSRDDDLVFAAGPLGLQLATIVPEHTADDRESYARLRQLIAQQRKALAHRVDGLSFAGEILATLQPGDDGRWIVDVLRELSIGVFVWLRMHARDGERVLSAIPANLAARADAALGSSAPLPLLLDRADVHLTRFSGVTLEAAAMGVPTVATEGYAADLYGRHVPDGALYVETSPRAIAAQIETLIAAGARRHASRLPDLKGLVPFVDRIVRAGSKAPGDRALR